MFGHRNWWNRILGTQPRNRSGALRQHAVRPRFELLEDRVTPASLVTAAVDMTGTLVIQETVASGGTNLEITNKVIGAGNVVAVIGSSGTSVNGATEADFAVASVAKVTVNPAAITPRTNDPLTLNVHDLTTAGPLIVVWNKYNATINVSSVNVSEAALATNSPGGPGVDKITVNNLTTGIFDATTGQGAGSGVSLNNVGGSPITNVTEGGGAGDSFSVTNSSLYVIGFFLGAGVVQGNGAGDSATIGPNVTIPGGVAVHQGTGAGDQIVVVGPTTVLGSGVIPDTFAQLRGKGDSISVIGVTKLGTTVISQTTGDGDSIVLTKDTVALATTVVQGNGAADVVLISGGSSQSTSVTQGKGGHDIVTLSGTLAANSGGPFATTVMQGGGAGDKVTVSAAAMGNGQSKISQTDGAGDVIDINSHVTGGALTVTQGNGKGDFISVGHSGAKGGPQTIVFAFSSTFRAALTVDQGNGNGDQERLQGVNLTGADGFLQTVQINGDGDSLQVQNANAAGFFLFQDNPPTGDVALLQFITSGVDNFMYIANSGFNFVQADGVIETGGVGTINGDDTGGSNGVYGTDGTNVNVTPSDFLYYVFA